LSTTVSGDGNKLKAIGQGTGTGAGTNTSGFSALLAGYRHGNGGFYSLGYLTYIWSSTESNAAYAYGMYLDFDGSYIDFGRIHEEGGFPVRCVKDF
jgi:uncharacterized protein (TIGR02145 family)